jgi:DNA invertase Pin-like site-specific DNA recombinase
VCASGGHLGSCAPQRRTSLLQHEKRMLHLYAALAEKERRLISEHTKSSLTIRKAVGTKLGNPVPLGFQGNQRVVTAVIIKMATTTN